MSRDNKNKACHLAGSHFFYFYATRPHRVPALSSRPSKSACFRLNARTISRNNNSTNLLRVRCSIRLLGNAAVIVHSLYIPISRKPHRIVTNNAPKRRGNALFSFHCILSESEKLTMWHRGGPGQCFFTIYLSLHLNNLTAPVSTTKEC